MCQQVDIKANIHFTNVFFFSAKTLTLYEIWPNLNLSNTFLRHSLSIFLTQYVLSFFFLQGYTLITWKSWPKMLMCPLFCRAGYQGWLIQMHKQSMVGKEKMKKIHNVKNSNKYRIIYPPIIPFFLRQGIRVGSFRCISRVWSGR